MKISIITICYNSAATIEKTIQTVLAQDYDNVEYIIVDGKSTDRTLDIVRKYQEGIAIVHSEKDNGIYDAMNKGVSLANGDLVGILNSDDFYADNTVLTDIARLFEQTNAQSVYADLVYVDRENEDKITRKWNSGAYKKGAFLKGWMPPHPTFFVRKAVYDQYGAYSTELRSAADYEFMLRVLHKEEISVAYLPRVITKMRTGGQSNVTLSNRLKANKEDRLAWAMNGLKPKAFTLIRKPLSKVFQFLK